MRITIHSIRFTAADHLKDYIQKKCDKLDKFFDKIVEGKVNLKLQNEVKGANKFVEIIVYVPGDTLVAKDSGSTFEEATDLVIDKLKTQLKRYKERLRSRA
jgi:putative sigma-54 modulation protein